jgi:cytochrome c553
MKHAIRIGSLIAITLLAPATTLADGKASEGQKKNSMCIGCHGIEGYRTVYPAVYSVPKIGGQGAGYIVSALKAYKAGDRSHPSMRAIAASLSEQDMLDLAAYYSAAN